MFDFLKLLFNDYSIEIDQEKIYWVKGDKKSKDVQFRNIIYARKIISFVIYYSRIIS